MRQRYRVLIEETLVRMASIDVEADSVNDARRLALLVCDLDQFPDRAEVQDVEYRPCTVTLLEGPPLGGSAGRTHIPSAGDV